MLDEIQDSEGVENRDEAGQLRGVDELRTLARRCGAEFVETVPEEAIDPALVASLPVEWARTHCLLPVRHAGRLCVLTADPREIGQQEYLSLLLGEELDVVVAPKAEVARTIERCYYSRDESPGAFLKDLDQADAKSRETPARGTVPSTDLLQVSEQTPVTQLVNLILLEAVKRRASDVHFEPFESRLRVRYRIDGVLYEQDSPPKHMEEPLVSRLKVMAHMDIAEKRLPQDGMARVSVGEREIDIRVSTVPVAEGERVVLRLLDRDQAFLPLDTLGMGAKTRTRYEELLNSSNCIIMVAGPTGSGKTTTLYATLGRLDASRRNILTIEEPIEYRLPDIGQIQVKPRIGLTFASGLRHILRQDPDVVLVGETRDIETAEIAVRASLTGHLVFTTLHTNDAVSSVMRLTDMGVEPYLLAACLRGVLAQRLVRLLCPACKRTVRPAEADIAASGGGLAELAGVEVCEPVGCEACLEGFRGRSGIFELMVADEAIRALVRGGGTSAESLRESSRERGMTSLRDDGLRLVREGATCLSEIAGAIAV